MGTERQSAIRLFRLQQILAHAIRPSSAGSESEAATVHLNSVPTDRIRDLTAELRQGLTSPLDAHGALTMRLLLNDYVAAVAHLRAVARLAADRVDGASAPIKETRRALHRSMKERDAPKRRAAADARDLSDAAPSTGESHPSHADLIDD